jgi:acetyl-CoA acetyltransferase
MASQRQSVVFAEPVRTAIGTFGGSLKEVPAAKLLRRDGLTRGLVTLCIGGGQGIALAIETLH